jgi:hypothetical protein
MMCPSRPSEICAAVPPATGRVYALHAADEDGFEFGPRLFPFLQDAPFHVLGLVTEEAKIGVYRAQAR